MSLVRKSISSLSSGEGDQKTAFLLGSLPICEEEFTRGPELGLKRTGMAVLYCNKITLSHAVQEDLLKQLMCFGEL